MGNFSANDPGVFNNKPIPKPNDYPTKTTTTIITTIQDTNMLEQVPEVHTQGQGQTHIHVDYLPLNNG